MTAIPLVSRDEFHRIAARLLALSDGDETFVSLTDMSGGTTRFANNQVVQNLNHHRVTVAATVAFGRRHGTATATDIGDEALRDLIRRATAIADVSPEDPEYVPPLPPQQYPEVLTLREDTAHAGPDVRCALAARAIELCRREERAAAGIVTAMTTAVGVAASTGLRAYEQRTEAKFSVTAMGGEASGWAAEAHRSIGALDVERRTQTAVQKAKHATNPKELPPGRYTVVLEPSAVAGLIGPMIWTMDAKSYYKHTSPFEGKLGRPIIDRRLTLRNTIRHEDVLANGFNAEGLPADEVTWIDQGVLAQVRYDRYTAQEHHVHPTPACDAPVLSGTGDGARSSLDELISTTERGILVTNFWYIRSVNPTDLTLTGMTRDGTFLIENGHVTTPVVNFRWHESPLRALSHVEAYTQPGAAVSNEYWKMRLPALRLADFNFSSVTRF